MCVISNKSAHTKKSRNLFHDPCRLLSEGNIKLCASSWRTQVVVTTNEQYEKRMVIDYSQTVNRFPTLDAYPLPKIEELVNVVTQYNINSTVDLKCVYHQFTISEKEKNLYCLWSKWQAILVLQDTVWNNQRNYLLSKDNW